MEENRKTSQFKNRKWNEKVNTKSKVTNKREVNLKRRERKQSEKLNQKLEMEFMTYSDGHIRRISRPSHPRWFSSSDKGLTSVSIDLSQLYSNRLTPSLMVQFFIIYSIATAKCRRCKVFNLFLSFVNNIILQLVLIFNVIIIVIVTIIISYYIFIIKLLLTLV